MRMILAFTLVLLATSSGIADTTKQEKAAYVIKTQDFRGQIIAETDERIEEAIRVFNAMLPQALGDQSQEIIRAEMKDVVQELIEDYMSDVTNIYLENLTDSEIDAIYKFYQSPEGRSLGEKLPEIERQVHLVSLRYLKSLSEQSVSRLADQVDSLRE